MDEEETVKHNKFKTFLAKKKPNLAENEANAEEAEEFLNEVIDDDETIEHSSLPAEGWSDHILLEETQNFFDEE